MKKLAIVDYGMGNLRSIRGALEYLECDYIVTDDPDMILKAWRIILPGVGSFKKAVNNIEAKGLREPLMDAALSKRIPLLGICLGMQIIASYGEEGGGSHGLGLINAKVTHLGTVDSRFRIPHIGFNSVRQIGSKDMFNGICDNSDFYFIHSYKIEKHGEEWEAGVTEYGEEFVSAIECQNVWGCQFHPEKSQLNGLLLLRNFLEL